MLKQNFKMISVKLKKSGEKMGSAFNLALYTFKIFVCFVVALSPG